MKKDELPFEGKTKKEKRRSWLRWAILAALIVAVALLWRGKADGLFAAGTPTPAPTVLPQATATPSAQTAREAREAAYEKDLAMLRNMMQDENVQQEVRQQAGLQIERMIAEHQTELGLEEALISAGFGPCMVLMQNDALTVMVSAPELSAAQSAAILSVCVAHTEVSLDNIRVMPGSL